MNTKTAIFWGSLLLCTAAGCVAWYTWGKGIRSAETNIPVAQPMARPIPTVLAVEPSTHSIRMFPGTVKACNQVDLSFSIDGVLVELNAQEGRLVHKGDVLARLDDRDHKSSYQAAKAAFIRAEADCKRCNALYQRKAISQARCEAAKAEADVTRAALRIRENELEDTLLIAPYDGVIARRYVEKHSRVRKQTAILALKDISDLEITIQVPERLMAHGGTNNFFNIMACFDIDRERWFEGRVKEYSVQSDAIIRTYEVGIQVQPSEDLEVLPGMTATVQVALNRAGEKAYPHDQAVALVPLESVFSTSAGKSFIWKIPEDAGYPEKIEVRLGSMRNAGVEVLNGLEPGQRVARAGIHMLTEETLVRPMKEGMEGLDG
ncbi:MAG: hypothetical protein CSA33_01200 [Desulfobulbus propionicus]|nr:MAG: hypothetical protein CSA33_01200 [Desulfobulbus propionicus]